MIVAKDVPWSSVVGKGVLLCDGETGRAVAQLAILTHVDAVGDQDQRKCAESVAKWVVRAFEALSEKEKREADANLRADIADKQIA